LNEKACRTCKALSSGTICPNCKDTNLSDDWSGYVILFDTEKSELAKKMGVNKSGKYAIRAR
jgi:DNA-directed RNA polymerase subunit E"